MADLETQIRALADRRFAETEPVSFTPDETADVRPTPLPVTNARPIDGTELIDMSSNGTSTQRGHRFTLAAVAGVIAIAVVGVALVDRDSDPAPPAATAAPLATVPPPEPEATTPPPPTTAGVTATLPPAGPVDVEPAGADGNAEANEAFAVVVEAFEAFNRGDALAWLAAAEAPEPPPTDLDDPEAEYVAAAHAAGARFEVLSCSYDGVREVGSVMGHRFTCQTKFVDAFTNAAGLNYAKEFEWTVADGQMVDADSSEAPNYADLTALRTFVGHLRSWMRTEHPDISFTMIRFYNYPLASEVPDVLPLLDEYVESSDVFP